MGCKDGRWMEMTSDKCWY